MIYMSFSVRDSVISAFVKFDVRTPEASLAYIVSSGTVRATERPFQKSKTKKPTKIQES